MKTQTRRKRLNQLDRPQKPSKLKCEVSERICLAMEARKISREQLALLTTRTPQCISNWMLGRASFPTYLVESLARILGVTPVWLAFGYGESCLPINNEAPAATEASISAQ